MTFTRRNLTAALAPLSLCRPALAQAPFPDRPLRLVITFGGGGQTDIVSRVMADALSTRLGQPVLADNRPGGNGNLAAEIVARSPPDGHTLLVAGMGTNSGLNALLYRGVTYDSDRDFIPVGMFCTTASMLVVHNTIPGDGFPAVVDWIRRNPGKFVYATASVGAITHLVMEELAERLGLDMTYVVYRQTTQAMADMLAGRVHARCMGLPEAEVIRGTAGVRAVALTTLQRRPEWPGIPTMAETLPGYAADAYFGLAVPARTPEAVVQRLNAAMNDALRDPAVQAAFRRVGADPAPPNTPAEFAARARADAERYGALIRRQRLVAE